MNAAIEKFKTPKDPLDSFGCTVHSCNYVAQCSRELLSHFRKVHKTTKDINSPCLYSKQCVHVKLFKTFSGLDTHLRKFHIEFFENEEVNKCVSDTGFSKTVNHFLSTENSPVPTILESSTNDVHGCTERVPIPESPSEKKVEPLSVAAGKFVMEMLADQKLTQVDMQLIMKGVQSLVHEAVDTTLLEIKHLLMSENCSHAAFLQFVEAKNIVGDLFTRLGTQYSQMKYFKEQFGLIMPKTITLPLITADFGRHNTRRDQRFRPQTYVYISLLDQIEQLLNIKDFYHEIMVKPMNETEIGVWTRYKDGLNYKMCELFQRHPRALQILVYLDEVQMCNPIGSYNHKLVYVYFSIGNLPVKVRSRFQFIHLLSIFYSEQVSFFDLNEMLKPIVEDFKKLEEGVDLVINGKVEKIFGTITAVVADNLASHQIGGFKAGFSKGHRKCRTCLAVDADIQNKFSDFQFKHRSKEEHDDQCNGMAIEELKQHFSWLYGINHNSVLNELKYFHVTCGLPPDIMHDLLEGVIPLMICEFLLYAIRKKFVTLNQVNYVLQNFNYGHNEIADKPSIIQLQHLTNKSLRQSASQKWLIFVYLPMMIGKLIPHNNSKWCCYAKLVEISRLVFKDRISSYEIFKLGTLIAEFLYEFKSLFKKRIIPKMHHMVHYPFYIKQFGPLLPLWCMRFEGKHSYFKNVLRKINNFINVPWSLSYRHQQWMCHKISSSNGEFLKLDVTVSVSEKVSLKNYVYGGQVATHFKLENFSHLVDRFRWLKINSTTFKIQQSVVQVPLLGSVQGQFGLVVNIFQYENRLVLMCKMFRTIKFVQHVQAFKVSPRNVYLMIDPKEMLNFNTYVLHLPGFTRPKTNSDFFVVTKTDVFS